ncbi:4-amino-4-deoxy-L-arabinose transferase [Anabaena sphaerica FACHB-251]|uniref:4-amino-4-deoxy-L-arabinose transferase n=1 Tax=Anabaena sphaerica FACHB-251 TaxID=2692883 RepID=A0A926WDR6_9NOST|nr:4-amino-4-deoxy-L-arabinose transferase [Anabaena sphaerica]MBD2292674.1 4-amino-4-deoxy-L-arabinose transferase [Anabaena sphaerica FACHB-251]
MLAGLLLIPLVILFFIFHNPERDWRSSVLSAGVAWGVLVTFFTEFLSLFHIITFAWVLALWLLTNLSLGWISYRLIKTGKRKLYLPQIPKITPVSLVLLSGVTVIIAATSVIAIVAPPNTWDSMTYHMARVVHWIQNRHLAHYPTYYSAQLVHPPFAEVVILHLQILSGGDRFANLVQTLSMIGSILGVSLIAKQLGADRRGQIFASVFCATLPMGILQASSTQNDYAVCFWVVCLAHYILLTLPYRNPPINLTLGIGASCGLAVFTKSSGYIYAFPFMVWFFLCYVNQMRWKMWKPISIISVIFLSLNINHYLRNFSLYASPISAAEYSIDYKPEIYSIPTWVSNIIRNLSLHADIVRHLGLQGVIEPTIGKVAKLITIIHGFLGVDINDTRITHPPNSYTGVPGLSFDENVAGNPLHLLLIFLAICIFICYKKLRNNREVMIYVLCLICSFLLICWMLKLQPYQSRHHLTIFVLFSAFVGLVFCQNWNRHIITILAVILLVTSGQFVLLNKSRPIAAETNIFNTTRKELYFTQRPQIIKPYSDAADFMKTTSCTEIGLSLGAEKVPSGNYWEYPFWVLLNENKNRVNRFKHILNPENFYALRPEMYPYKDFKPCAIIAVRRDKEPPVAMLNFENTKYIQKWSSKPITILMPQ